MFVTVVAVMCHMLAGVPEPVCQEEIVTDSSMSQELNFFECMSRGQAPLAKWKDEHPIYRSDAWKIQRYKCVPGHYEIKGSA